MAISVDPGTRVVTILQADLTFVGGSTYQLDTDWLRIQLRDWEDSEVGIVNPKTHQHNTAVTLGGIQYARVIEIINGYTLTYEEKAQPYVVTLSGSNNNFLEVTNLGTVQILSNNSAGLINVAEVQYAAFDGGISYDEINGIAGTNYPVGSKLQPVNNLADAITIALARGFDDIFVNGDLSNGATSIAGYRFFGKSATLNATKTLITLGGGSTSGTHYHDCRITGQQSGESNYHNCIIDGLTNAHCLYIECGFADGTGLGYSIQQSAGPSAGHSTYWRNCFTDEGTCIIDRNGGKLSMFMDGFHGNVKFINNSNVDAGDIRLHMNGGIVTIDSTCTQGVIYITGDCEIKNQSGGTVVRTGILQKIDDAKIAVESLRTTHQGYGHIVYVDPINGLDANEGETQLTAVQTFARAHAIAHDGENDVVQFINPSNASYTHVEDMVCTKNNVHIRATSRDITFKPATTGNPILMIGDRTGLNGYGCSAQGMLLDGDKAGTNKALNCIEVNGKFSLLRGIWAKQSTGACILYRGGDYHVIEDGEIEKADTHGVETFDAELPSGSPREITIFGRSNIYLNGGDGVHIGSRPGAAGGGDSTRIVRILSGEINYNGGWGVNADAGTHRVVVGKDVNAHGNALGYTNLLGLESEYIKEDDRHHDAEAARDEILGTTQFPVPV